MSILASIWACVTTRALGKLQLTPLPVAHMFSEVCQRGPVHPPSEASGVAVDPTLDLRFMEAFATAKMKHHEHVLCSVIHSHLRPGVWGSANTDKHTHNDAHDVMFVQACGGIQESVCGSAAAAGQCSCKSEGANKISSNVHAPRLASSSALLNGGAGGTASLAKASIAKPGSKMF